MAAPPSRAARHCRTWGEHNVCGAEAQASRPWHCFGGNERLENIIGARLEPPLFFTFAENANWNAERQAVEFGVEIGEYRGVVRVPRRVFQRLLPERPPLSAASRRTIFSARG